MKNIYDKNSPTKYIKNQNKLLPLLQTSQQISTIYKSNHNTHHNNNSNNNNNKLKHSKDSLPINKYIRHSCFQPRVQHQQSKTKKIKNKQYTTIPKQHQYTEIDNLFRQSNQYKQKIVKNKKKIMNSTYRNVIMSRQLIPKQFIDKNKNKQMQRYSNDGVPLLRVNHTIFHAQKYRNQTNSSYFIKQLIKERLNNKQYQQLQYMKDGTIQSNKSNKSNRNYMPILSDRAHYQQLQKLQRSFDLRRNQQEYKYFSKEIEIKNRQPKLKMKLKAQTPKLSQLNKQINKQIKHTNTNNNNNTKQQKYQPWEHLKSQRAQIYIN